MPTNIQTIKTFPQLVKYLRTELVWPVKDDYLKSRQAPAGERPALKAWMELN